MELNLSAIRQAIVEEMDRYLDAYDPPANTVGKPWGRDKVAAELVKMRSCLIEPYWIDVDITDPPHMTSGPSKRYPCVAVAKDNGHTLMVFMPHLDEYLLLGRFEDSWKSIGVDGDAVGAFLAR